jgi:poly(3-hydroxybutyrate) depolymerase
MEHRNRFIRYFCYFLILYSIFTTITTTITVTASTSTSTISKLKTFKQTPSRSSSSLSSLRNPIRVPTYYPVVPEIGPGANSFQISRPEGLRSFYIYFPESYFSSKAEYPVLFAYHGLGDTCEDFGPATNFSWYADNLPAPDAMNSSQNTILPNATSFIYVYPCATTGWIGTAWNAGTCCLQPTSVDDVAFTSAMISFIELNFRVDSTRFFAAGFSNGAMMAEVLACQLPFNFSAAASVSGVVEMEPGNDAGLTACDKAFIATGAQHHVSVLNIHGYQDEVVPWDGDSLLGFPPIPQNMADWALRNICTNKTITTFSNGPYSNSIWNDCNTKNDADAPTGLQMELVKNANGGHEWPSDQYFDTTSYVLSFLFRSTASKSIHKELNKVKAA